MFHELLTDLFSGRPAKGLERLQAVAAEPPTTPVLSGLRLAIQRPGQTMLYYQKLFNIWSNWTRPALKPNVARRKLVLLTDFTADGFAPLMQVFAAAWGVDLEVQVPSYDSVEQLALGAPPESLGIDRETILVLLLSDQWLHKYLGQSVLVPAEGVRRAQEAYLNIVAGLKGWGANHLLLANWAGRPYAHPTSFATHGTSVGWNVAWHSLNAWLTTLVETSVHVVDVAQAIFAAGGASALGQLSYFRARMAFEPAGAVAVSREVASAVASICGKAHRAVVTDWDNTLWGGEVAEAGSFGVVCGVDSPAGLAYWRVQDYLKQLRGQGTILAAVSRNSPKVQAIFEENAELALKLDDFASLQVDFVPKSLSIAQVAKDLGFGTEFMVFLDDSLFELVEAVSQHPYLDVLRAGPDGETTLAQLSQTRFANAVQLSDEDVQRAAAAQSLKQQRDLQSKFTNIEEFLRNIDIEIQVTSLDNRNMARVVQLLAKSNQFNLTTRRHGEAELRSLLEAGCEIGVFSYSDTFGPQGIISVVILEPGADDVRIDSWLMSCRVLNRTVEEAVFAWILERAGSRRVVGEYLPTAKNELVRELLPRFGFALVSTDAGSGRQLYHFEPAVETRRPTYFARLQAA